MRIANLLLLLLLLSSCASSYTDVGQKKDKFYPSFNNECREDDNLTTGYISTGSVCEHDNGIIFLKPRFQQYTVSLAELENRAEKFCKLLGPNKKVVNKGDPNLKFWSKFGWTGIEFICM